MWKPVKLFEDFYEVSDEGEIKSVARHVENGSPQGMWLPERILKPTLNKKNGYLQVSLRDGKNTKVYYVHRLVAESFLENPNNLPTINHKDGNKLNNNVSNLEYNSYSENNQHAYNNGLHKRGEDHYLAKLTEDQVRQIKKEGKKDTYENIALKYGVTKATIRDILIGKTWKNIN